MLRGAWTPYARLSFRCTTSATPPTALSPFWVNPALVIFGALTVAVVIAVIVSLLKRVGIPTKYDAAPGARKGSRCARLGGKRGSWRLQPRAFASLGRDLYPGHCPGPGACRVGPGQLSADVPLLQLDDLGLRS